MKWLLKTTKWNRQGVRDANENEEKHGKKQTCLVTICDEIDHVAVHSLVCEMNIEQVVISKEKKGSRESGMRSEVGSGQC